MEAYLKDSYQISEAEQARLMRRIRHSRAQNQGTPWPVPLQEWLRISFTCRRCLIMISLSVSGTWSTKPQISESW